MTFADTKPTWRSVALLVLLAPLLYAFLLSFPEIRLVDEAIAAAYTDEMVSVGRWWKTHLYGMPVPGFPLYSWLAALCSGFRLQNVVTLRLPALLSLLGIALASGLFARKVQSLQAGLVSAMVVLTTYASYCVGWRAQIETVVGLLLSCAWYLVYTQGWQKNRWWLAWSVSFALVFVASLGVGCKAFLIFYLPFCFLWKEFSFFEKMQSPAHCVPLGAFVVVTAVWLLLVPGQPYIPWNEHAYYGPSQNVVTYASHLAKMLPYLLLFSLRLLPLYLPRHLILRFLPVLMMA
jgi:hypothetical protein